MPEDSAAAGHSRMDAAMAMRRAAASGGAPSHTSAVTAAVLPLLEEVAAAVSRREAPVDPSYGSCTWRLSWPAFTEPWSVPFRPL